jgi:hypothetical protein
MLRFVRCLVSFGATAEEASAVVTAELERISHPKREPRRTLVGMRWAKVEG